MHSQLSYALSDFKVYELHTQLSCDNSVIYFRCQSCTLNSVKFLQIFFKVSELHTQLSYGYLFWTFFCYNARVVGSTQLWFLESVFGHVGPGWLPKYSCRIFRAVLIPLDEPYTYMEVFGT